MEISLEAGEMVVMVRDWDLLLEYGLLPKLRSQEGNDSIHDPEHL